MGRRTTGPQGQHSVPLQRNSRVQKPQEGRVKKPCGTGKPKKDPMERPRGLEPPPTAWQAVVLPLYYGRFATIFYSMAPGAGQGLAPRRSPARGGLADPEHARELHHRGLPLALRELHGFVVIGVDAGKLLAVVIKDGYLPVPMLSALIFAELSSASFLHVPPLSFHRHYVNFDETAQVTTFEVTRKTNSRRLSTRIVNPSASRRRSARALALSWAGVPPGQPCE